MAAPLDLLKRMLSRIRTPCLSFARAKSSTTRVQSDFSTLIQKQYQQAKRSVIVRTQNPESTIRTLQKYDNLNSAFFTSSDEGYILAEYGSDVGAQRLMQSSGYFATATQFPLQSRCICDLGSEFKRPPRSKGKRIHIKPFNNRSHDDFPVLGSLDAELLHLHKRKSLGDLDLRMRFMVCLLVEELLQTLSPDIRIVPFGSCLNGFGWRDSDLDMMLCFYKDPFHVTPSGKSETNMKYLTEVFRSERHLAHHTLSAVAALLELMPRTTKIHKILHARVPIIRFQHILSSLDCDISLQAVDSIRMTELLYFISAYEERLKLLMTGIKEWAVRHGQTSSGEKQKPTTLGLLFLLIFFLQTRSPPVLPTLRQVQSYSSPSNGFVIEGVRYSLPSSQRFVPSSSNTESIESLFHGFFKFFSTFDFETQGISITEGCAFKRTADTSPLLVENPLCIGLNICKNVSLVKLDNLQAAMTDTVSVLEKIKEKQLPAHRSWLSSLFCGHETDESVDIEIESIFSDFDDEGNSKDLDHVEMGDNVQDNFGQKS